MLSFADLLAAASGLNATPILQEAPAGRLAGQSSAYVNDMYRNPGAGPREVDAALLPPPVVQAPAR